MSISFSQKLLAWHKKHGRHDLPWQTKPTSYRVWISEIMLQQTQVATVIPYFNRFMHSFPSIKSLVAATEDNVLSHWSGLGYYARARNIYKTAKIIHEQYCDHFPETVAEMQKLPGIGESTAGAIISFSMQKKAVILDGNVKRVLTRYFAMNKPINQKNTIDELWLLAKKLTPTKNAHHYNQAIMDLGATLCTRLKPRCHDCPLGSDCKALLQHKPTFYPIKTEKKERPIKKIKMLIIQNKKGDILLEKRKSTGIWGGLWSLMECSCEHACKCDIQNTFGKLTLLETLPIITHQFTHFTLIITPIRFSVSKKIKTDCFIWYTLNTTLPGGVAAPVTKILKALL